MEAHRVERRLAAILHADVKGYSRLIGEDEVATLRVLAAYLEMMSTLVQRHGGRAVGSRGDSLLAEFPSVVEAVQCAVEMQHELKVRNVELPVTRRVEFRMGINLGEIVVEGEQIHGDGINIAVRLEGLAEAGGIFISEIVYEQVKHRMPLQYAYVGERTLKNIERPVRVWQVQVEESESPKPQVQSPKLRRVGTAHRIWVVVGGVALIMAVIVTVRYLSRPPLSPQSSVLSPEAAPAALPLPDKPSIVVLPFVNMSEDPKQDYFSDGLTEVLTGDLSKISSLFVIARNSAFTYKGKAVKVQDVGREMGVRYVLEGSVQRADQRVRITTQLIDATTGYHLWSEQYDRPLKDIFALQDEIVQKIVTTLRLQLTLQEEGFVVRKHTNNPEAYDAYLRGMGYHWGGYTKETIAQAQQMYEKAFALDPQYADAYVWLGWSYTFEWGARWSTDPQILERALALAQKAITLDDSLPVAHLLLSWVYSQKQQYDQALAESERAISLDPNNADSYAIRASVLNFAGRPEEALRAMEQAVRLNPGSPPWYLLELGHAYYRTGQYAQAIATMKELSSRSPNYFMVYVFLAANYVQQWAFQQSPESQTLAQALAAGQRAIALDDTVPWNHWALGTVYLWQQQYDQALAEMRRTVTLDPNEAMNSATLAEVLSYMDRSADALEAAEQALRLKPTVADGHLYSVGIAYALAGRPDEAIAPLKQYLTRYPNILGAHLTLAVVYSELSKEAEARAEVGEVLRINPQFSLEVHKQRVPIKDPAVLERHIAALRKAGLK